MSTTDKLKNPVKAIRAYCLSCAGNTREVDLCPIEDCYLYPFRYGKNPYRAKHVVTEEQRIAAAERFRKYAEQKKKEKGE